jgi:site-specific recombinase
MTAVRCKSFLTGLLVLFPLGGATAAEPRIDWPPGWVIEALPAQAGPSEPAAQIRQRAVKNDQAGNPLVVMELTQTALAPGHDVNVQGVLLEMRKAVQVNFARGGLQSACTHVRESRLGSVAALETTCTVTQNGVHVLTQTLVAAAAKGLAWSLSYAGSAEGYAANRQEMLNIRKTLTLEEPGSKP